MTQRRSPLAAGLSASFSYRRLAGVLWLGLVLSALPAWFAFGPLFAPVDSGPFRESVLGGWDSWAFLSFLGNHPRETGVAFASVGVGVLLSFVLDLLLTTGAVRVLLSGLPRPALRRTVAEGAALFRPVLLAWVRWALSLVLWLALFVAAPVALLSKAGGADAPPNGPLATVALLWAVVASLAVVANTSVRFSLARIALARGEAATVRAAFRASKGVLRGARTRAAGIWLFWFAGSLALQAAFTAAGVAMNPATGPGVAALVVVRQLGFGLLAATRIGYQASLIAFGEARRPLPPLPLAHPVAAGPDPRRDPPAEQAPEAAPAA